MNNRLLGFQRKLLKGFAEAAFAVRIGEVGIRITVR